MATHAAAQSMTNLDESELGQRVAVLASRDDVTIRGMLEDDRIYRWIVEVRESFVATLPGAADPAFDARAAVRAWTKATNVEINELTTRDVAKSRRDPMFNRATDVRVVCFVRLPNDERLVDVFVGPTSSGAHPPEGTPRVEPKGVEVTVEVEPDRAEWTVHQAITGTVRYRNTGTTRIPLLLSGLCPAAIAVTDHEGTTLERLPPTISVTPSLSGPTYTFLAPGEAISRRFHLETDPGAEVHVGYDVAHGAWQLTHRDLLVHENIPTRVVPAPITVVGEAKDDRAP